MVTRGAALLVKWRRDNDLTQTQACERMGRFSAAELSAFETGRRGPSIPTAIFFLEHCAIPIASWAEEAATAPQSASPSKGRAA